METARGSRVWLSPYDPGQPAHIVPDFSDMLALFRAAVARARRRPAVLYFVGAIAFDPPTGTITLATPVVAVAGTSVNSCF